ncbi:MAG: L-seryl-tRNA(Sec) selenium transferase [Candidatus Aminicenantes bacterium]|nr:L-seryl-tRNA(Sec) selenium transferase [Candidatus Aminicenantes bacterium]
MNETLLRQIPSVDSLLADAAGQGLVMRFGREAFLKECRGVLDDLRSEILADKLRAPVEEALLRENLFRRIEHRVDEKFLSGLQKAVNATGILMHSGLGRAVLSEPARQALDDTSLAYCTLALDLETGRRGQRDARVSRLLAELTGAEAATLVNNNAAATVLILHALAKGKEVIVSRGQLVEIGGSFRMPDVMSTSGAILREVGTTNKTHLRDYAEAIGPATGAIIRVHHSNYRIVGFTAEPEIEELVELGAKHGVPVIDDLGSGALVDLREFGLQTEPMVARSVKAGADVACFSGDKLIGGPQSGLIVGKADAVNRIKKDPLARAFRCGKLTIAAMEATLKLFLRAESLKEHHPLYRMLSLGLDELQRRARRVERSLKKRLPSEVQVSVVDDGSQVGSGSVPVETIPTKCLSVKTSTMGLEEMAKALRLGRPPVFSRIHKNALLFDFRTIQPVEDKVVEEAIRSLFPQT